MTWAQTYLLFGRGLVVSAAIAALPIATLLFVLGVLRKPAWVTGLGGLGVTLAVALGAYRMPVVPALSAAAEGVAFGLFPITWIIFWALTLFHMSVETGQFAGIKQSIGRLTSEPRMQALLIAFAFGAFLEGAAGFGAPVAIASTMLIGLGFSPFAAASLCLLGNTAPVTFGSIGIPILTLAATTGLPAARLSAAAGRLCTPIVFILPAYMVLAMWGMRGLSGVLVPTLVAGAVYAGVEYFVSVHVGAQLTNILSALAAMAALVALLRVWRPAASGATDVRVLAPVAVGAGEGQDVEPKQSARMLLFAWLPYLLLVTCVLLWGWTPVRALLDRTTLLLHWPGLHNVVVRMPPIVRAPLPYPAVYVVNWLAAAGTACMVATLLSAAAARVGPRQFLRALAKVTHQLRMPTLTVTSVLAMAFLMNYCGATATLGLAFAATGAAFPFFSAALGWLGVFITGSDTSSNALFGNLQVVTATRLGFDPVLMAATNSVGGVMGKMISLHTIAIAAAATGISVAEQSKLLRGMLKHAAMLVGLVGVLALLMAYGRW